MLWLPGLLFQSFRVYGKKVAEIPLVGTRLQYRRHGMCRILMDELEKVMHKAHIFPFSIHFCLFLFIGNPFFFARKKLYDNIIVLFSEGTQVKSSLVFIQFLVLSFIVSFTLTSHHGNFYVLAITAQD